MENVMRAICHFWIGKPERLTRLGDCVGFIGYFLPLAGPFTRVSGMVLATCHGSSDFPALSELYPGGRRGGCRHPAYPPSSLC